MGDRRPAVVVTRPRDLAAGLCDLLREAGAEAVEFPVIEIIPLVPVSAPAHADLLFFVSRNAVRHGLRHVAPLLAGASVAAVGSGTAAALTAAGVAAVLTPPEGAPAGGAGLLRNPSLTRAAMTGRRALVVRGEGGNEELVEGLRARGAEVECLEVYRRAPADSGCLTLSRLRDAGLHPVLVLTSSEGVRHLFDIAGPGLADWLRARRYVAISPRVAEALRHQGVAIEPVLAEAADDRSLCAAALSAVPGSPYP